MTCAVGACSPHFVYTDDVVTFLHPSWRDVCRCLSITRDFGITSGLVMNFSKCSAHPIRCSLEQRNLIAQELQCEVLLPFPCSYLGQLGC